MIRCIISQADEVGDVLVDIVTLHVQLLDLGASMFRLLSIGVLRSELFQELVPGVLVIGSSRIVGPYPHSVLPVAYFFSRDE